jgi:NTE family protein
MTDDRRGEPDPFRDFLLSDESNGFRAAFAELQLALDLGLATGKLPDPDGQREAASVVANTLTDHAGRIPDGTWRAPTDWISGETEPSLDAVIYRARAIDALAFGGYLVGCGVGDPDRLVLTIARLAFGVDPRSIVLGDVISKRPLDVDPSRLPPSLGDFADLMDRTCMAGVLSAGSRFGQIASQRPRPLVGAQITDVDPSFGCAGDTVTIRGTGFGQTRPQGVTVQFTSRAGGCVSAQVVTWSDTEITVTVPADVGHGCVGLTEQPQGFEEIFQAADQFAGELETCLGPMAGVAGGRIRDSAFGIMHAACPSCTDPRTRFIGGPPVIRGFTANGRDVAEILPGDDVTVRWTVDGADEVTIVSVGHVLPGISEPYDSAAGTEVVEDLDLVDGTVGSWRLTATNRCGSVTATISVVVRGRIAIVLSGGGAKGAFEVGAVRCLRDVARIQPDILSGSSVGALNAAKLAEGGTALADLEQLWLRMQGNTDLYLERPWFRVLEPPIRAVFSSGSSSLDFGAARIVGNFVANKILGSLVVALGIPGIFFSIFTSVYPVITGIIDLVRYYDAIKQAMASPSIFLFTPIEQMVNTEIDPAKIARSKIKLRVTAVALETGRARVFDENGTMLDSGFRVPLRDAVRASASIPIAFPPVPLSGPQGTELYIDGGVRENVPIQAAVEAGAHRVFAILLNPTSVELPTSFAPVSMIKLAGRTVDLVLDEGQRNDIGPFRGFGVPTTVIAPSFVVHDTLMVDPGLISINMDYGYMRAFDEVVADPAQRSTLRRLTDEITALRIDIWTTEHFANAEYLPGRIGGQLTLVADPINLQACRDNKKLLRTKTYQRITASAAASVPGYRANWWRQWERHPWQPRIPTPWDAFTSRKGTLPQESPPPA